MLKKRNKRIIGVVLALVLIVLFFRKCSSATKTVSRSSNFSLDQSYKAIPADATFICAFNLPEIMDEIEFNNLKNSESYVNKLKSFYNQNPPLTRIFNNPQKAGVDVSKKAVFYFDVGTNSEEVYSAIIFSLSNAASFAQMLGEHTKFAKIEERKNYKYVLIAPTTSIGWSQGNVVFLSTFDGFNVEDVFDKVFIPQSQKYFDKVNDFYEFIADQEADASFWLDLESYSKNQLLSDGNTGKLPARLLKDNYIFGDIKFDTGVFDVDVFFDMNMLLSKGLKSIFKEDQDRSIADYIPNLKPAILATLSLNIDGIFNFLLDDIELKVEARNSLVEYGLMIEDFGEALTGDILLAGFPNKNNPKGSILFGMKIKNKEHFSMLLRVMQDVGKIELISNGFYRMNTGVLPTIPFLASYDDQLQRMILIDDYAFVSLDKKIIEALQSKDYNSALSYFLPLNNGQQNYISIFGNSQFKEIAKYSDQFSIKDYSLNYNGEQLSFHFNLVNADKSSLKQMLSLD